MLFVCYPRCTTCQKAKKWLLENGVAFDERHIMVNNPTFEELKDCHNMRVQPLIHFFITSGQRYRLLMLMDKLPSMCVD